MTNHIAIGIAMILYGVTTLLNFFGITHFTIEQTLSIVLILFGLISYLRSFHNLKRGGLFLISILMNIGIFLFVLTNFEILNWYNIITPSIFYVVASGLMLLYIENKNEFVFLISAIFFFVLAICSVVFVQTVSVVAYIHRITLILFDFWPVFLIIFGVLMMVNKPRRKSTRSSAV